MLFHHKSDLAIHAQACMTCYIAMASCITGLIIFYPLGSKILHAGLTHACNPMNKAFIYPSQNYVASYR